MGLVGHARLTVRISEDRLRAEVTVLAGEPATEQELRQFLEQEGVTFGIDENACRELGAELADSSYRANKVVLACGDPGEPGQDAKFNLRFASEVVAVRTRPDGSMDLRERSLVINVATGDQLGTYRPPTAGLNDNKHDHSLLSRNCTI